jgi:hypothetical protein
MLGKLCAMCLDKYVRLAFLGKGNRPKKVTMFANRMWLLRAGRTILSLRSLTL